MKTGDKVKVVVKRRAGKRIGGNPAPNSFRVSIDGERGEFRDGEIMQVSRTTKKIVNRNAGAVPLVSANVVTAYGEYFKIVEKKKSKKKTSEIKSNSEA